MQMCRARRGARVARGAPMSMCLALHKKRSSALNCHGHSCAMQTRRVWCGARRAWRSDAHVHCIT
eukprot:2639275-Karenia_brevis.AAC.1